MNAKNVGRRRRVGGWGAVVLGTLAAGAWVWSGWWWFACDVPGCARYRFRMFGGQAQLVWTDAEGASTGVEIAPTSKGGSWLWWRGWDPRRDTFGLFTSFEYAPGTVAMSPGAKPGSMTIRTVVFWPVPLVLWACGGVVLWRGAAARRRVARGACVVCGYSLSGLEERAGCPECGAKKSEGREEAARVRA